MPRKRSLVANDDLPSGLAWCRLRHSYLIRHGRFTEAEDARFEGNTYALRLRDFGVSVELIEPRQELA